MGNNSFFVSWPYVAIALLVLGTLLRYLLVSRRPSVLAAAIADAKAVFGGRLFWISIFVLLAGHLVGLLFPQAVLSWNSSTAGLYLLEGVAFAAGLAAVAGSAALIWRHLGRSSRPLLIEFFDTVFLATVFTVLVRNDTGTVCSFAC
jgi:nitrate reductase gamma subunit